MTTATARSEDLSELMTIMVREVFATMAETGCSLEQAMDCGAKWIFEQYPTIAAAIVLEAAAR